MIRSTQLHMDGARRFGFSRWSEMVSAMITVLQANREEADEMLVAELAWNACMQAWGKETAHSADAPCTRRSVGVLAFHEGKLLLVERLSGAVGVACPAGHVENDETYEQAGIREIWEETGVRVAHLQLLAEGRRYERCKRMESDYHDWQVFLARKADFTKLRLNPTESKRVILAAPEQLSFFARRTNEHIQHLISDDDFRRNPGFERVWLFWLLQTGYLRTSTESYA